MRELARVSLSFLNLVADSSADMYISRELNILMHTVHNAKENGTNEVN